MSTEQIADSLYRTVKKSGDWQGCTTATVSLQNDQYIVASATKGWLGEADNGVPSWYTDDTDYLGIDENSDNEDMRSGATVSEQKCGASGGGGPEVRVKVVVLYTTDPKYGETYLEIDGKEPTAVSLNNEQVSEIEINGTVVWTGTTDPITYNFDDMSPWTTYNGGQNSGGRWGSNNYYSGNDNSGKQAEATPFPNGEQIRQFSYWYYESSSSTGHGVRLVNSNGDYEGGTATDNPEFDVDFANSSGQLSGNGSYSQWVNVTWSFDWENGKVTVSRTGSDNASGTYDLKQGVDVSKVELWNYNGGTWGDNALDGYWDNLEFVTDAVTHEGFESNSLSSAWTNSNNFYPNKGPSFSGSSAGGSRNNGSIEATWRPLDEPTEIESFEYKWWETGSQTGHVVILEDASGNEIMESGNENPQWYLNNGSGGRTEVYGGDDYKQWTEFEFTFDWTNGEYDYILRNTATGTVKSGTQSMDNNNPVDHVRFTGDGYGSADEVVFDDIRIR